MSLEHKLHLHQIAEEQGGLFIAQQAIEAGFDRANFDHYVATGEWLRIGRGLYKLAVFQASRRQDFWEVYLWSRNKAGDPQGVFSYESALDLYDVSDVLPAKIHMTVPGDFRRSSAVPTVLKLYREDLRPDQKRSIDGLPCTSVIKTVHDLILRGGSDQIIRQAVSESIARGLITQRDLQDELTHPETGEKLKALIGG